MNKKNIVFCADDFGMSQQINEGILQLVQKQKIDAVSCMTNYDKWPEGAIALKNQSQVQVGLHFNLKAPNLPTLIALAYYRLLKPKTILAELDKQYKNFIIHFGKAPDFIDGHQHIHQLPVIRDVLIAFYNSHLRNTDTWIRSTYNHQTHWKARVINLLGGKRLDALLKKEGIPHNANFSGIYNFAHSKDYASHLEQFIQEINSDGLIMCHPGLEAGFRLDELKVLSESSRLI